MLEAQSHVLLDRRECKREREKIMDRRRRRPHRPRNTHQPRTIAHHLTIAPPHHHRNHCGRCAVSQMKPCMSQFTLSLIDTVNDGYIRPTNIQIELMKVCVYQIPRLPNRLRSWRLTIITDSGCFFNERDERDDRGQQDWKRSWPHGLMRPVMYQ